MIEKEFIDQYIDYVKICIADKGIYPYPGMFNCNDNKIVVSVFAMSPADTYLAAFKLALKENAIEFAFGIDRYVKEGQGMESFKNVFSILYFSGDWTKPQVILLPYNSKEDYGELQYNNEEWNRNIKLEFESVLPLLLKRKTY